MAETQEDPLAAFARDTARPAADTSTRMKERLGVYVAQERARRKRRWRRLVLTAATMVLVSLCVAAALVLYG